MFNHPLPQVVLTRCLPKLKIYHADFSVGKSWGFRRLCSSATVTPVIRNCLVLDVWPERISMLLFDTPKCVDRSFINSAFAAPSMGGEVSLTLTAPSISPPISLRDALGTTRTVKHAAPSFSEISIKFYLTAWPL